MTWIFQAIWKNGAAQCNVKEEYGIDCAKTAERTELPFGLASEMGPRNRVLDEHTRLRHLANTVVRLCTVAINGSATRSGE